MPVEQFFEAALGEPVIPRISSGPPLVRYHERHPKELNPPDYMCLAPTIEIPANADSESSDRLNYSTEEARAESDEELDAQVTSTGLSLGRLRPRISDVSDEQPLEIVESAEPSVVPTGLTAAPTTAAPATRAAGTRTPSPRKGNKSMPSSPTRGSARLADLRNQKSADKLPPPSASSSPTKSQASQTPSGQNSIAARLRTRHKTPKPPPRTLGADLTIDLATDDSATKILTRTQIRSRY